MKVELENDEAWNLLSHVVVRVLDEVALSDSDRARVRRWKSEEMRPTSQEMRVLTSKMNEDLSAALARKTRSQIRKPDWV
ncbi:MAG TPA: hypothetical protein VI759_06635 [Dehalococcoidia bacterium]|nr:hypothetical protein [Dehalococcoidia bacterium]